MKRTRKHPDHIFVDESIHDPFGFIVTAFVCIFGDPACKHEKEFSAFGLKVGIDEYKSSFIMSNNPVMQKFRSRLFEIATFHARVAILISPREARNNLGNAIIDTLNDVINNNGLDVSTLKIFFDQGIFASIEAGAKSAARYDGMKDIKFYFEQDSKCIFGLQIADAIAHTTSQILKQELSEGKKQIDIGGEGTGYPEGTIADLGWELLMTLRYTFFTRPVVLAEYANECDPSTKPIIVHNDDDLIIKGQNPELFGWGVFISKDAEPELKILVEKRFSNLWLGCIH